MTRFSHIGWCDEFRIGLYGTTRRVLAPRGAKVRQPVEIVRDWYHLFVVVAPRTGELGWAWLPRIQSGDIAAAVRDCRERGFDALVCDRLPGHVNAARRAEGVAIILQPVASPEVNPAERVGEEIHRAVDGKVYGTIWHKMAAVETVLRGYVADPESVRELTGWNWILATLRRLPLESKRRWKEDTAA